MFFFSKISSESVLENVGGDNCANTLVLLAAKAKDDSFHYFNRVNREQ